nr:MAG TPA: hypothetical protein [Caudoviricetes sp.]
MFVLLCVYGYIIYCNTVYVKRLSKYFIKTKVPTNGTQMSRKCPP